MPGIPVRCYRRSYFERRRLSLRIGLIGHAPPGATMGLPRSVTDTAVILEGK